MPTTSAMPRREDDRPLPDYFTDELERGHARWLAREQAQQRRVRRTRRQRGGSPALTSSTTREWLFAFAFAIGTIAAIVYFTI